MDERGGRGEREGGGEGEGEREGERENDYHTAKTILHTESIVQTAHLQSRM